MDLSRLRAGMNRLAGAVKRTDTTTPLMWGEWAVVQDPNLPSVVLESDWQQTPRPVRNAAGRLEQYQRVYVLHQGPITTIVANPGLMADTGWQMCTLLPGFTGNLWVRRLGRVAEISGSVDGTFPAGNTAFGTVPTGFEPAALSGGVSVRMVAQLTSFATGTAYIYGTGSVGVIVPASSATNVTVRGTYILD